MSDIGSVTGIYFLLPAGLGDAWDQSIMGHFAQATTTKPEVAIITARAATNSATIVQAHGWIFAPCGRHPAFVLFINH
jgi:hypothetical protein